MCIRDSQYTNPLRILDTKNPALQELCAAAPRLIDFLGAESLAHFEGVQRILRDAGLPYKINPRLVRGLDYYNLTVFEWVTDCLLYTSPSPRDRTRSRMPSSA